MIDLVLWANDKATFHTFAITNNMMVSGGDGGYTTREGFEYSWWAGSGKLMTAKGTYDGEGAEITPPTFLPGFVALCRIHSSFFGDDVLVPDEANPDAAEQWAHSKFSRYVKNNGAPGTDSGVSYYELDGVRLFRYADLQAKIAEWDVPGHEWLGGNVG
jgi:hypothetical protein